MKKSEMIEKIRSHKSDLKLTSIQIEDVLKLAEEFGMAPPYNQEPQYDGWIEACIAPVGAKREWEKEDE